MRTSFALSKRPVSLAALALTAAFVASASGCGRSGDGGGSAATTGTGAAASFCVHEVESKHCPICHPELRSDPNVLLCKEHDNIPEDICTLCHPELKAKYKTCDHGLPPAFCATCVAVKK